jgi:hypothetical protein
MKIKEIKENLDGSADFMIEDLTDEEATAFIRLGIIKALEMGIEESQKYEVKDEDSETASNTD